MLPLVAEGRVVVRAGGLAGAAGAAARPPSAGRTSAGRARLRLAPVVRRPSLPTAATARPRVAGGAGVAGFAELVPPRDS